MYRYTTPTLPITIEGIDFSEVDYFRIAIERGDNELLFTVNANDESVDAETNTIYISLTQEQTAQFEEGYVRIQARIKYLSGVVQATQIAKVSVHGVLDEVVI